MLRLLDKDFWVGLSMLLAASIYWIEADKIRISPLDGPVNAAGLPKSLAYALGGLALILVFRSAASAALQYRSGVQALAPDVPAGERMKPHLRAAGMLAIGIGYLLTVSWLGYIATIIALLLAVSVYNGARLNLRAIAFAVCGGVFFHIFFVEFLGIPLPAGAILEPLLG
ncbi:MAG: tripartite tricarboxylate transporter TctB family protein [Albidovulum sp.]|nr:tripartite tricarboxylate transporter TctB family protein [Albidovulum sp.]